jgi:hypothetical protein
LISSRRFTSSLDMSSLSAKVRSITYTGIGRC